MTKAVAITRDGVTVFFELADEPEIIPPTAAAEGTAGLSDVVDKIDSVADTIVEVCSSLHQKAYIALGAMKPQSFELEFGVTLAGEAGVPLVTKGTAECTFKVTAKWEPSADPVSKNS